MLTLEIGHRVSRRRRATYRRLQFESIISLPNSALQCRPPQDHTARHHPLLGTRRCPPITPRHLTAELPAQVVTALCEQHCCLSVHMVVQLPVLA